MGGALGAIDGSSPKGVETAEDVEKGRAFLRMSDYKRRHAPVAHEGSCAASPHSRGDVESLFTVLCPAQDDSHLSPSCL